MAKRWPNPEKVYYVTASGVAHETAGCPALIRALNVRKLIGRALVKWQHRACKRCQGMK